MIKSQNDPLMKQKSFYVKHDSHDVNTIEGMEESQFNEQLLLAHRLFSSVMEGIMVTNTAGDITFVNEAFSTITGYGKEIIGLTPRMLKSGHHQKPFYDEIWKSVERMGQWKGEIWNKRQNGDIYVQWTTMTVVKDDLGQPIYYASVFTDITQQKREAQRLDNDLRLAHEVQKGLLSKPIKNDHIHIEGVYSPSTILGGDMYVWYKIDEHRYGIFLLDVMGHGVAAALVSMSVRSLLRGIIHTKIEPEKVIQELNHHVISLYRSEDSLQANHYYLTGIYAVIDTKEKIISYASAGHPPGFLIHENGTITEMGIGSVPLGMLAELDVQTGFIPYTGNIKLVFYTDGMIEDGINSIRDNIERVKGILTERRHLQVDQLLTETIAVLLTETNSAKFQDDATLIVASVGSCPA